MTTTTYVPRVKKIGKTDWFILPYSLFIGNHKVASERVKNLRQKVNSHKKALKILRFGRNIHFYSPTPEAVYGIVKQLIK